VIGAPLVAPIAAPVVIVPQGVGVAIRPAPPPVAGPVAPAPARPVVPEPARPTRPAPAAGPIGNTVPQSFRAGYPPYLRSARIGEVAALALPGVAGIVALTAMGGLVGYRQAKAGHAVRAAGTARFLQ
jgi:hypothetical protein